MGFGENLFNWWMSLIEDEREREENGVYIDYAIEYPVDRKSVRAGVGQGKVEKIYHMTDGHYTTDRYEVPHKSQNGRSELVVLTPPANNSLLDIKASGGKITESYLDTLCENWNYVTDNPEKFNWLDETSEEELSRLMTEYECYDTGN